MTQSYQKIDARSARKIRATQLAGSAAHRLQAQAGMKAQRKPVSDQVIVITGASSGVGHSTAVLAAKLGAKLMLSAKSEEKLREVVREVESYGAKAECLTCDITDENAMCDLADATVHRFGRIDTWFNSTSVSIYGRIGEIPLAEMHRIFETNFWGTVNGTLAALPYLKESDGTVINMGSILSDTALPLQGIYSASKFAIKGFSDSLRLELETAGVPVTVSLIRPSAIADREKVAQEVIRCAENRTKTALPTRAILIGAAGVGAIVYSLISNPRTQAGNSLKLLVRKLRARGSYAQAAGLDEHGWPSLLERRAHQDDLAA